MYCDICRGYSRVTEVVCEKSVCPICKISLRPPSIIVVKKWNGTLWLNPITDKFLVRDISWYIECGFEVKSYKIYLKKEANPEYGESMRLMFKGKVACPVIQPYNWPVGVPSCVSRVCLV